MWVCSNCGELIEEEDIGCHREPHGEMVDDVCSCGGQYVEAERCRVCDEWFDNSDGYGVCECCMEECETVGMALKMGENGTEMCEINGFVAAVMTKEQINRVLEKWVEENFVDGSREVRDYLYRDKGAFAELVEDEYDNEKEKYDG